MKGTRVIAACVWVIVLLQSTASIFIAAPKGVGFPPLGWGMAPMVLLPLIFFSLAGLFIKSYPFYAPSLQQSVDSRFGDGVYAELIVEVKPLLLFAVSGIYAGLLMIYAAPGTVAGNMKTLAAFMISAGVSFWLMRTILAKRGLLMESPGVPAPWSAKEFTPSAIRRIQATNWTAFLAGGWTMLGMTTSESMEKLYKLDHRTSALVFFLVAIPFFYIPVAIFVFGIQNKIASTESESYWRQQSRRMSLAMIRGFCWMAGAIVFSLIWTPILGLVFKR